MNSEQYDPSESGLWYMGTFGPSFGGQGWNEAYDGFRSKTATFHLAKDQPSFLGGITVSRPLPPEITLPWPTASSQESQTAGQCSYLQDRKHPFFVHLNTCLRDRKLNGMELGTDSCLHWNQNCPKNRSRNSKQYYRMWTASSWKQDP